MIDQVEIIPSKTVSIIQTMLGAEISNVVRFSWWEAKESAVECEIDNSEVFSYTEGPLLIYLKSGEIIGFASDEKKNSIVLWCERDQEGNIHEEDIENDEELFPISFDDPLYSENKWLKLRGQKIKSIQLIKRKPTSVKYEELPNEVGLKIELNKGGEFIVCHKLCGKTSNLSVTDLSNLDNTLIEEIQFSCIS